MVYNGGECFYCLQGREMMHLNISDSQILWAGKSKRKPEGIIIPTHLKVLTIEEKPFIYVRRLEDDEAACDPKDEIPCPLFNATEGAGKCGEGVTIVSCG